MKKIITILTPLFFLVTVVAKAEVGVGVTGALHSIDASGTETTRTSLEKNTGSHTEEVLVPEIFVEAIADNGFTLGISYIPTREMGSKSRTDAESPSDPDGDDGTYTAKAELDNVIQAYADIPLGSYPVYVKVGVQHVTLVTLESLNSGSTYPDADLMGFTYGLGHRGELPYGNNLYYKVEATYTDFDSYTHTNSVGNKLEAELDDTAVKFSLGYKF